MVMREKGWVSRGGLILALRMLPLSGWLAFDQFSRQKDALLAEPSTLSAEQHQAVKQMLEIAECQIARMRLKVEQGDPAKPSVEPRG